MGAGILLSGADDIDFMIHGVFQYELFGQKLWITTTHVCLFIDMAIIIIFCLCANRAVKRATEVPGAFQNVVELIVEMLDKGAIIALPYGVEGFATPKHLVKQDGTQAQVDEKLNFKVIEFNKDGKRIFLSHSRIFEDEARAEKNAERRAKRAARPAKQEEAPLATPAIEKTTLGDIEALAALKEKLSK